MKNDWVLSSSSGGRFLEHDPVFSRSQQEEFIISAIAQEVQVLAVTTSLLVKCHGAPDEARVLCYAVESCDSTIIHIAYDNGIIESWDWEQDAVLEQFPTVDSSPASAIAASTTTDGRSVVTYSMTSKAGSSIYVGQDLLHTVPFKLKAILIVGNVDYIVVRGSSAVVIGLRTGQSTTQKDFIWAQLPLTHSESTCVDARITQSLDGLRTAKHHPLLSLAVAYDDGQIHLYDNTSSLFRPNKSNAKLVPRVLHWHHNAVGSLKFSRDGVYLISGGSETVLILWQLNTGKKQFLPHLTASILNIAVNFDGDRYAIQFGDNSIMVLSTSELKPVANFAGLQLQPSQKTRSVGTAYSLHSSRPDQLLITVPPTISAVEHAAVRPFLQTFDIQFSRHVTRQALTRNNVTDLKEGPEGNTVVTPDVLYIKHSYSGQWLASVDEWTPPKGDWRELVADKTSLRQHRESRREVYLKFWRWDEASMLWSLVTRADAPHARAEQDSLGAGQILALEANPRTDSFVTVGEDHILKFWVSKKRKRHGVVVIDGHDEAEIEWMCAHLVRLPFGYDSPDSQTNSSHLKAPLKACSAFSNDGSILAVSLTNSDVSSQFLHLIRTSSGEIIDSISMLTESITTIGFIGRDLLGVSSTTLYRWDVLDNIIKQRVALPDSGANMKYQRQHLLASNFDDHSFALSVPGQSTRRNWILVYAAETTSCLYKACFPVPIEAIISRGGMKGYLIIFADATIRTLSPASSSRVQAIQPAPDTVMSLTTTTDHDEEMVDATHTQRDIFNLSAGAIRSNARDVEDDRPVVRPEQLAQIFDVGANAAMPPVREMLRAFTALYTRPPLSTT